MIITHKDKSFSSGYRVDGKTYFFKNGVLEAPEKVCETIAKSSDEFEIEKKAEPKKAEKKEEKKNK